MIKIKRVIVKKEFVRAPVHMQIVTENGEQHLARFETVGFVSNDRILFLRTD